MRRIVRAVGCVGAGLLIVWVSWVSLPWIFSGPDTDEQLSFCAGIDDNQTRLRCLIPYFEGLTRAENATFAVSRAIDLQRAGVIDQCHLAAHFIGRANLAKNRRDAGRALAACPLDCIQGCQHGVMEAYVAGRGSDDLVPEIISFCKSLADDPEHEGACLHGMGHGLVMVFKDRPSPVVDALEQCRTLGESTAFPPVGFCTFGVFMENVNQYMLLDEGIVAELIPTLCDQVVNLNRSSLWPWDRSALITGCHRSIGETLIFSGYNVSKTIELCRRLPAPQHQRECVQRAIETERSKQAP